MVNSETINNQHEKTYYANMQIAVTSVHSVLQVVSSGLICLLLTPLEVVGRHSK